MYSIRSRRLVLAGCLVFVLLGCGESGGNAGGSGGLGGVGGGTGGLGGAGGDCTTAAINACLDLQDCCTAVLFNPVFFQACNSVVLQCNEAQCNEVLAGYVQCRDIEEP